MTKVFGFEFKPELYYNTDHVWVKKEQDGNVRIGFDEVVARGAHEIYFIKMVDEGTIVKQKKKVGVIESRKYTGPIVSPVSGTVIATNPEIDRIGANAFVDDPWEKGWLAIIKPSNYDAELSNLLTGDKALEWYKIDAEKAEEENKFVKTVPSS